MKLFEAFSGYGSQRLALNNLGIDIETIGIAEIDQTAIKAYETIHGPIVNYGDISKINPNDLPDFDIFTYSFPCQDISSAGYKRGLAKGSDTRSSLLWDCEAIIESKRPKYLLLENVKDLVSVRFNKELDTWLSILASLGYKSEVKLLNSKDFGVPQNRNRVFVLSRLNDDITWFSTKKFDKKYLIDFTDEVLDTELIIQDTVLVELDVNNLKFTDKSQRIATLPTTAKKLPQSRRIYSDHGLSVTLDTGYTLRFYDTKHGVYRKASGTEYLRLMGMSETDITKLSYLSNNKKAILAGNSIVIPVLEYVFSVLLKENI